MEQLQQGGTLKGARRSFESTVRKYKQLYEKEVSARAKSDGFSNIAAV